MSADNGFWEELAETMADPVGAKLRTELRVYVGRCKRHFEPPEDMKRTFVEYFGIDEETAELGVTQLMDYHTARMRAW